MALGRRRRVVVQPVRRNGRMVAVSHRAAGTSVSEVTVAAVVAQELSAQIASAPMFMGLAERGGFEPPVRFYSYNGLANRRFRPLSHLSRAGAAELSASPGFRQGNVPTTRNRTRTETRSEM